MTRGKVIRRADEISVDWLSGLLGQPVRHLQATTQSSNWSSQVLLSVELEDGTSRALRLKICSGPTFGRSEVDYYTVDYVGLANAPLVRCHDARYEANVGYHVLLDDLAATHRDRRGASPTLEYGLAVAEALAPLHAHRWQSGPAPEVAALDRYFDEIRPGVEAIERATGMHFRARFEAHEHAMRERWSEPSGMSLLHGDLNPTNILTPAAAEHPVYFLDRQPFDWSLTYGVAAYDLAYFLVPWWPSELRHVHEEAIVRRWYDALDQPDYAWAQAQADWDLCVEQCLHVPFEWCSKPDTAASMRWLWEMQLARIQHALSTRDNPSRTSA